MIKLPGQIHIRTIQGRNGAFNVARLVTAIGEFAVKDSMLEQYAEGKYDGEFLVTKVAPSSWSSGGRTVIEVRAYLDGMTLDSQDDLTREDEAAFQAAPTLPPDEPTKPAKPRPAPKPKPSVDEIPFGMTPQELQQLGQGKSGDDADAELFGTLWPLGQEVKLDATLDRETLRDQRLRLQALGYKLDFKQQLWIKGSKPEPHLPAGDTSPGGGTGLNHGGFL